MSTYSQTQNNFFNSNYNPQNFNNANKKLSINQEKLWQPSSASLNYISPRLSFSKETRFKLHSIYWPQNLQQGNPITRLNKQRSDMDAVAKKISKKIDEQQKNEIRIKRKRSTSINQNKIRTAFSQSNKRKVQQSNQERKKFILDQKNEQILKRLFGDSPNKQSYLRDRHGIRSNLREGQDAHLFNVVKDEMQTMGSSKGFKTSSRRLNLNLPHNYYPGPGSYEIKRYLQEMEQKGTQRSKTARQLSIKIA